MMDWIATFTALCWQEWYRVAKIVAEQAAFEYAEKNGLNVVTLCPPLVFGPLLQPTVNASSKFLIYVVKGILICACSIRLFSFITRIVTFLMNILFLTRQVGCAP